MGYYLLDRWSPTPQYGNPRRYGAKPSGVIVIHTAENYPDLLGPDAGAENVARFIANRSDYGSYHRLVDSDSIIKMAPFWYETWHDTKTNWHSIGISGAVRAHEWHKIPKARRDAIVINMAKAAAEAAKWLKAEYGITVPAGRVSRAEAHKGIPGFIGHGESDPVNRSDPGPNFDWNLFFKTYRAEMAGIDVASNTIERDWLDMASEADVRRIIREELKANNDDAAWAVLAYKGKHPDPKKAAKGEKDPRDVYSYIRNMPYLVWAKDFYSRYDADGSRYQAAEYLVVNNDRLNTLIFNELPKLFGAVAALTSNENATADELRAQINAIFEDFQFEVSVASATDDTPVVTPDEALEETK